MWMPVLPLPVLPSRVCRLLSLMWAASRTREDRVWALPSGHVQGCTLQQGDVLHVQQGHLWLTRSGDARDHVLAAGQSWVAQGREQVLLEAVGTQVCELRRTPAGPATLTDAGC